VVITATGGILSSWPGNSHHFFTPTRDPPAHLNPTPRLPATGPKEERGYYRVEDYALAPSGKRVSNCSAPFPVDRATYDRNISVLTDAVRKARLGQKEKCDALKRLAIACQE